MKSDIGSWKWNWGWMKNINSISQAVVLQKKLMKWKVTMGMKSESQNRKWKRKLKVKLRVNVEQRLYISVSVPAKKSSRNEKLRCKGKVKVWMKSESEFVNENFKWYIVESESEGSYQKGCRQLKTRPHYQGILRKALGTWVDVDKNDYSPRNYDHYHYIQQFCIQLLVPGFVRISLYLQH